MNSLNSTDVSSAMGGVAKFDLTSWKLTLPVDASGGTNGNALEIKALAGFQDAPYFQASDAGITFYADTAGATTTGSHYARSELREMNGSQLAGWSLEQGGELAATLVVDKAPTKSDGGVGREVIGQIHGQQDELVRLYWDNGKVYFVNDKAGPDNKETTFQLLDASGKTPDISLGEKFSYDIDTHNGILKVALHADGQDYTSTTQVSDSWSGDKFYFKAGVYLGVGEAGSGAGTTGTGAGQTTFDELHYAHDGKPIVSPVGPLLSEPTDPTFPASNSPPSTPAGPSNPPPSAPAGQSVSGGAGHDDISGTSGSDVLKGGRGNDVLSGGDGNDSLWGNAGNDTLIGGSGDDWLKGGDGSDLYVFAVGHGHDVLDGVRRSDTLSFDHGLFKSVAEAQATIEHTSDGILVHTGEQSSILFTHATVSDVLSAHWLVT